MKKDVRGIPVWWGPLVLSLGYHGKVVLGRAKLKAKELGKDINICQRKITRAPAEKYQWQGINMVDFRYFRFFKKCNPGYLIDF